MTIDGILVLIWTIAILVVAVIYVRGWVRALRSKSWRVVSLPVYVPSPDGVESFRAFPFISNYPLFAATSAWPRGTLRVETQAITISSFDENLRFGPAEVKCVMFSTLLGSGLRFVRVCEDYPSYVVLYGSRANVEKMGAALVVHGYNVMADVSWKG